MNLRDQLAWREKQWWALSYASLMLFSIVGGFSFLTWLAVQPVLAAVAFPLAPQYRRTVRRTTGEEDLGDHPWRPVVGWLLAVVVIFAFGFLFLRE